VQKDRTFGGLFGDDDPISAATSLPFPSNPLLNERAAEIGINQSFFGALPPRPKSRWQFSPAWRSARTI
jgi:hypothetical protein